MKCLAFLFILLVATAACAPLETFLAPEQPQVLPINSTATNTPTPPTATPALEAQPQGPCAYMWASASLPELSARIQSDVDASGLSGAIAFASAYGENCVDGVTNEVRSFGAMETNFQITISVTDMSDQAVLQADTLIILKALQNIPVEDIPGGPSKVTLSFTDQTQTAQYNGYFNDLITHLTEYQAGDDVLAWLTKLP